MIYLIAEIFFFLLLALAAGAAGGWLIRHTQALKREEALQRTTNDAQARLPQLETMLRARDEALEEQKRRLKERNAEFAALEKSAEEQTRQVRQLENALKKAEKPAASNSDVLVLDADASALGTDHKHIVDELHRDIARLQMELGARDQELVEIKAASGRQRSGAQEHERQMAALARELDREKRAVAELERELELQTKSLRVLHQQLDLERQRPKQATG